VQNDGGTVTVAFRDGAWGVTERYGYPVKYETLATFLEDLQDLTVAQAIEAGESQYGRLKLNEPGKDAAGALVTIHGEDGQELASLIFGKEHMSKRAGGPMGQGGYPDGRYLRAKGAGSVMLVSKSFGRVDDKPSSWLNDEFFKIGDIKEATLSQGGKELWKVSREEKTGDLKLAGDVPAEKEVDTSKLGSIKSAFSWARFSDVADPGMTPEDTGLDKAKTYVAREFDGSVFTIVVGKKSDDGKYYLTVAAAYVGPTERLPVKDEKPEDKEKNDKAFTDKLAESQKKAADLNARTKGWVYLVDAWTVENVTKTRDKLLKDKPKPKEDDKAGDAAEKDEK